MTAVNGILTGGIITNVMVEELPAGDKAMLLPFVGAVILLYWRDRFAAFVSVVEAKQPRDAVVAAESAVHNKPFFFTVQYGVATPSSRYKGISIWFCIL